MRGSCIACGAVLNGTALEWDPEFKGACIDWATTKASRPQRLLVCDNGRCFMISSAAPWKLVKL